MIDDRRAAVGHRVPFYEAHRRQRRAARLLSVLAAAGVLLLGLPLSVVVSPFIIAVTLVVVDLLRLVVGLPDLTARAVDLASALASRQIAGQPASLSPTDLATVAVALLVPGTIAIAVAWLCVRRLFMRSAAGAVALAAGARAPDGTDFEEHQLVNLVHETAVAAGVPPPRVLVLDGDIINAAVVGRSAADATLLVHRDLLARLGRAPTGAIVADLLATAVNGDLRAALVIASAFQTFDLMTAVLGAPADRATRAVLWRLLRLGLRPGPPAADEVHYIADELAVVASLGGDDVDDASDARVLLTFPFLVAWLSMSITRLVIGTMVVSPLLAALWRRRRLSADATAVELTRDPDALARALAHLRDHGTGAPTGPWSHLFIVGPEVHADRLRRRMDELRADGRRAGESRAASARRRIAESREAQRGYLAAAQASDETTQGLSLDAFLPRPQVRLQRLADMGAGLQRQEARWPDRPTTVGGWVATVIGVTIGWPVLLALLGCLVLLVGAFLQLAMAFEMLLLAPVVLVVHAVVSAVGGR